jgi:hypothetical protein
MDWSIFLGYIYIVMFVISVVAITYGIRVNRIKMTLGEVIIAGLFWWVIWPKIIYEYLDEKFQKYVDRR